MEFFVRDMEKLPQVVERRLSELRQMDANLLQLVKTAATEEAKLFEDLAVLAKTDPEFEEAPVVARFEEILRKRQDAQTAADEQMKKIQKLYDLVDGRITYIGKYDHSCSLECLSALLTCCSVRRLVYERSSSSISAGGGGGAQNYRKLTIVFM
jgi:hypothetical protein